MYRQIILGIAVIYTLLMPPASNGAQNAGKAAQSTEALISRCREVWQPHCAQFGIPDPNASAPSVEAQIVARCREVWQPHCSQYGIPDPNASAAGDDETPAPVPVPPTPTPPPVPPDVQQASILLISGPQAPRYPRQTFDVTGFSRAGWPLAVDYQAPAGARVALTVRPLFGGYPFQIELPPSTNGERQIAKVRLEFPGSSSDEVGIARYEVEASLAIPGRRKAKKVPVRVFGFGAGPRAVGSVAINDIVYAPTVVKRPTGANRATLRFDYRLINAFDLVAEELWRDCKNKIFCNFTHPTRPFRALQPGRHRWDWSIDRRTNTGQYYLSVRGWQNCAAKFNPGAYKQCGDEAAWVAASAGPVFVQK